MYLDSWLFWFESRLESYSVQYDQIGLFLQRIWWLSFPTNAAQSPGKFLGYFENEPSSVKFSIATF